jgi:hypothetical protein
MAANSSIRYLEVNLAGTGTLAEPQGHVPGGRGLSHEPADA